MNNFSLNDFLLILPETFLVIMSCAILLLGVFAKNFKSLSYYLVQLSLIVGVCLTVCLYYFVFKTRVFGLSHTYTIDSLAIILKIFVYITAFFVFIYSRHYNAERNIASNEFHVLGLLSTIGMLVLISSYNLLTLYLGLELLSLPLYALVALQRAKMRCIEAAMKYFVVGGLASGLLLYGISIFFGMAHSLDITVIAHSLALQHNQSDLMLIFALVFVISGMAFKLGAVPFHMWVPDVYDGAPTSVTLLISTAPKIASVALFVRFLAEGLPGLFTDWQQILFILGILSVALGNIVAIVQVNIKRLLAYSSIAHMGYVLLAFGCGTVSGNAAAIFYVLTYALMSLGAFGMVALLSRTGFEANNIEDFAGLNNRNPWLALMMMILMFSMAGVPPLVGFIGKLAVLNALIEIHYTTLAIVTLIFSIVGAYYYIRVIKVMYFDQPTHAEAITYSRSTQWAMSINGIAVLLLGIFPSGLFTLCQNLF